MKDPDGKRPSLIAGLPVVATVFFGAQLLIDKLTFIRGGDSTVYVLLSRSISSYLSYSDLNLPGRPPHVQYPPLLPLVLSPIDAVFGYNFLWMRLVIIVMAVLAAGVLAGYLRQREGFGAGTALALLAVTNFYFIFFMREILAEVPYLLFSVLAIERLEREEGATWTAALFLAAAALTRTIGIVLIGASVAAYIGAMARNMRRPRRVLAVAGAAAMPFLLWTARNMALSGGEGYGSIFLKGDYYNADRGVLGIAALFERVVANAKLYFFSVPRTLLFPIDYGKVYPLLFAAVCLIVLALILLGLAGELRKRAGVVEFYVLFYLCVLILWPVYGSGDSLRYLMPVIPFLYLYLYRGAAMAASVMKRPRAVLASLSALLFIVNILSTAKILNPVKTPGRVARSVSLLKRDLFRRYEEVTPGQLLVARFERVAPCFGRYIESAFSLREATEPDARIAARKPEIVSLITGRYVMRYPFTADEGRMLDFFVRNRIDYLMVDYCYRETNRFIYPFIMKNPGLFEEVKGVEGLVRIRRGEAVRMAAKNPRRDRVRRPSSLP